MRNLENEILRCHIIIMHARMRKLFLQHARDHITIELIIEIMIYFVLIKTI